MKIIINSSKILNKMQKVNSLMMSRTTHFFFLYKEDKSRFVVPKMFRLIIVGKNAPDNN